MENQILRRSCATHSGTFHADEVTACAMLLLYDLIDREHIYRTRDPKVIDTCEFVCDVGGVYDFYQKRFDHHQSEYRGKLSSAGMILKYLKHTKVIDEKYYFFLNRSLILGVDAIDNGRITPRVGHCSYSSIISNFVPITYAASVKEVNQAFFEALDFAYGHLKRLKERYKYIHDCRKYVKESMNPNNNFLLFDAAMPWMESFFELGGLNHPAQFVVMPSGNHWKLRGIPPTFEEKMKVRIPLPEKWGGLLDKELEKISGINGAIFCHKGLFISVWETKEAAMKALEYVLNNS
ncbi:MAG: MYG1 family protein [Simkaniaceae bacterium]|nr:MYG1 family protein [Simkaniaceae bacterium]